MKWFNNWVDKRLQERDHTFMQAAARNAALNAIHYYVALRTIKEWHRLLDEAEKSGEKYLSLAELIIKSGYKK